MTEEKFIRVVERTANAAIATGRDTETVIHDVIEVLYGRKNINELLPSGWLIANNCNECVYKDDPGDSEQCFSCYNKLFNKNIIRLDPGPYTNNFKPKKEVKKSTYIDQMQKCSNCKYDSLTIDQSPCRECYYKGDGKPYFTPIDRSVPIDKKEVHKNE